VRAFPLLHLVEMEGIVGLALFAADMNSHKIGDYGLNKGFGLWLLPFVVVAVVVDVREPTDVVVVAVDGDEPYFRLASWSDMGLCPLLLELIGSEYRFDKGVKDLYIS